MVGWNHCLNGYDFDQLREIVNREAQGNAVHGVAESNMA